MGALEERAECCGYLPGAGEKEQDRLPGDSGSPWRDCAGAAAQAVAALRLEEREEISRGIAVGRPLRQIAQGLGRAPSTVSREIRRNGGSQAYRANRADRRAWERAWSQANSELSSRRKLRF